MGNLKVLVVSAVAVAAVGVVVGWRVMRGRRRRRLMTMAMGAEQEAILQKNLPLYRRLPVELQRQLQGLVHIFLAEKRFVGCGGQAITDEVRLTIAGQACLLLLNRNSGYFPRLRTIYVYPTSYVAPAQGRDGLARSEARQGESWQNGPVALAWNSVTGGAQNIRDGRNVVLHEFSHQLDQEDGVADGAPILGSSSCAATWTEVLGAEYDALQKRSRKGRRSVLQRYGATHPAEFFAVATEAFFEKPRQMHKKHPELYEELKQYYQVDPEQWHG